MECLDLKVSIITVSYNSAKTIEQTIQSVVMQSYKNIEYIIIDGDSTDGTQQIIDNYKKNISYYVSEKDNGLYYAMNKGIQKATGDIIGIINSDDWYAATAVEDMVYFFQHNEVEIAYGITVMVDENGREKIYSVSGMETMWYQAPFSHPSVFVKKSVYDRIGAFNVKYRVAADYDFLLRAYAENIKFGYLDKIIAYFRLGGLSTVCEKIGHKENYVISLSYVHKSPDKQEILPKIENAYRWSCFKNEYFGTDGKLRKLLDGYFDNAVNEIIIFGTGIWGENCYKTLVNTDVSIRCFADNNTLKWNTMLHNLKIINPRELSNIEAVVLVAVKAGAEEICRQLKNLNNDRLKYVSIVELFNEVQ